MFLRARQSHRQVQVGPILAFVLRVANGQNLAAIAADSSLSSSYAFGSRVQSLLDGSKPASRRDYAAYTTDQLSLHQQSKSTHVFDIPSLPTEQEAFGLLETLVTYIGHTQNYVDAREISDKIGLLYANKQDSANAESLWTLEILLICAIARLFKGDFGGDTHRTDPYPGYALFNFARDRIPPLGQLYSVGRVGVEVLALVAVYLQNIYCKEEAYLYVCISPFQHALVSDSLSIDKHRSATGSFPRLPPPVCYWAAVAIRGYSHKSSVVVDLLPGKVFTFLHSHSPILLTTD